MSTILDALKKSERERTLVRGIGFGDAGRRLPREQDRWLWPIVAMVFVVVIAAVAVYSLRNRVAVPDAVHLSSSPPVLDPKSDANVAGATTTEQKNIPAPVSDMSERGASPLPALTDATPTSVAPVVPLVPAAGEASFLSALAPDFQRSLPEMVVNIHVYAPEESLRILYVNNRQYRRGDEIQNGVVVEEIVADGVVLQFRGQRFKLPRPS